MYISTYNASIMSFKGAVCMYESLDYCGQNRSLVSFNMHINKNDAVTS